MNIDFRRVYDFAMRNHVEIDVTVNDKTYHTEELTITMTKYISETDKFFYCKKRFWTEDLQSLSGSIADITEAVMRCLEMMLEELEES